MSGAVSINVPSRSKNTAAVVVLVAVVVVAVSVFLELVLKDNVGVPLGDWVGIMFIRF